MKRHAWRAALLTAWSVGLLSSGGPPLRGAELGAQVPTASQVRPDQDSPSQPALRDGLDEGNRPSSQAGSNDGDGVPDEGDKAGLEAQVGEMKAGLMEHLQAALILDYATLLIAAVTAAFAVFALLLAGFGLIEWARFKELRKELAEEKLTLGERIESFKCELEAQRKELAEERRTLETRIETFKAGLETQEQRLAANQRFLEAVLSHHSNLLVGIVEGFGAALKPDEARRLGGLIFEAEAALDLFYPDRDEVLKALMRLELIGAHGAVSSLVRLRDDNAAEPEIRVRAQQVLSTILERLKKERREAPAPPPRDRSHARLDQPPNRGEPPAQPAAIEESLGSTPPQTTDEKPT